jgi:uncharacterized glyoxalase superfamily protein PhnB
MESLAPNIFVKDITKTIEFYQALGFKVVMKMPENGEIDWVMMSCGKVTLMFQTFKSLGSDISEISRLNGGSLLLYIKINEIRKFFERINVSLKDKLKIIKGLEKTFYGATEFSIQDLNGYVLTFAEDE